MFWDLLWNVYEKKVLELIFIINVFENFNVIFKKVENIVCFVMEREIRL